jgi:RHS repeat-associated protein
MTEMDVHGTTETWNHTNVWAGGKLLATYDKTGAGLHFYLDDPLGTRRAQTDYAGVLEQTCASLPYGDSLNCANAPGSTYTASLTAPTEHHFTGKERDAESGNDYFGARYYSSNMGRFMSPDWSAKEEPVPYAKLDDPQTLNLYAYMLNSPLNGIDADGHAGACGFGCRIVQAVSATAADFGITEGHVRAEYNLRKDQIKNITSEQREDLKIEMRQQSTPLGEEIAIDHNVKSLWARVLKTAEQRAESAPRTNPAFNKAGAIARKAGPVLV